MIKRCESCRYVATTIGQLVNRLSRLNKNLKIALICSTILNLAFALSNHYERSFDSYPHVFFADHYRRMWFNSWEPKWYTGFSVTSYPPLGHQSVALLSYLIGLEGAYTFVVFVLMIMFPAAIFNFSKCFVSDEAAGYASMLSVFFPSILQAVYIFGQYTTLFGLVASLFALSSLQNFLRSGNKLHLIHSALLVGVAASAHHFTAFFFLPLLILILFTEELVKKNVIMMLTFRRMLLFIIAGTFFSVFVIHPFLMYISTHRSGVPVIHPSTTNIFCTFDTFKHFFLNMYGPMLVLFPLSAVLVYRNNKLIPPFSLGIFLFVLGLGGTTILPSILFGSSWKAITSGKFSLYAGTTFLPLFGSIWARRIVGRKAFIVFLCILILFTGYLGYDSLVSKRSSLPLKPLVDFLGRENHWKWRYLTLGFGFAQSAKLNILSNATTLDGSYLMGRDLPELRYSGVGRLDAAKFFDNGLIILEAVLKNSSKYSLRFVLSNDVVYEPIVNRTGYSYITEYDSVTVWEKNETPMISDENHKSQVTLSEYIWGIAPLLFLTITFLLATIICKTSLKREKHV